MKKHLITDRQPDSGNPTVRDERGACGNVSHGGIRNPLHRLKGCMMETLHLKPSAPYFYPTGAADKAAIQRVKVPPCQLPDSDM